MACVSTLGLVAGRRNIATLAPLVRVFGAGCGLLTYVIRTWAGYPEGVAFAVLLMNSLTPVIDSYMKPRVYGRDRAGKPLKLPGD